MAEQITILVMIWLPVFYPLPYGLHQDLWRSIDNLCRILIHFPIVLCLTLRNLQTLHDNILNKVLLLCTEAQKLLVAIEIVDLW